MTGEVPEYENLETKEDETEETSTPGEKTKMPGEVTPDEESEKESAGV